MDDSSLVLGGATLGQWTAERQGDWVAGYFSLCGAEAFRLHAAPPRYLGASLHPQRHIVDDRLGHVAEVVGGPGEGAAVVFQPAETREGVGAAHQNRGVFEGVLGAEAGVEAEQTLVLQVAAAEGGGAGGGVCLMCSHVELQLFSGAATVRGQSNQVAAVRGLTDRDNGANPAHPKVSRAQPP